MTDHEILEKVYNRMKNKTDHEIIVALEKEIDYLRDRIKRETEEEKIISFRVTPNTNAEQLYNFLFSYVPMGEVLDLYKIIKKAMEV